HVFVGAGTTELISLVTQSLRDDLLKQARDLGDPELPVSHLVEPTYGEYKRSAAQNGLRNKAWPAQTLGWDQDFSFPGARRPVWTGHPNNPTGRASERDRLLALVDHDPSA